MRTTDPRPSGRPRAAGRALMTRAALVAAVIATLASAHAVPVARGAARARSQAGALAPATSRPRATTGQAKAGTAEAPLATVTLSNERTTTIWAHPSRAAPILASPPAPAPPIPGPAAARPAGDPAARAGARRVVIARLRLYTEDGFPEVYMALAERSYGDGDSWVRIRVPGRPNGRVGWVSRDALGRFHTTHWLLVVDRRAERLTAYWSGHRRFAAPVGIGAPGTPTPAGRFWVREKFPIRDRASGYWPDAFGTADYSTLSEWPGGGVVGIHGPYGDPSAIPGRPSHGCIRLHTGDVAWLYRHIPVGAALRVV